MSNPAETPTSALVTAAKPKRRTSLGKGMALNWLSLAIGFTVSFVVTPIIIRKLGATGYGMWALILSFSGYYGLVNLGLNSALQRFIGMDLAKNNAESLQETISTALSFFCGSAILIFTAALTLSAPAARFFSISPEHSSAFVITLVLCATSVVLDFFNALASTIFSASERFDLLNRLGIGRNLAQSAGILLVLQFYPSINGLASVVCIVSASVLFISWPMALRLVPELRLTLKGRSLKRLKALLHYGSATVLLRVSNLIRFRVGNVIIARASSVAAVAQFSIASNLILNFNSVIDATLRVLTPRFTRLHAEGRLTEMRQLYRTALFGSSAIACGMGLLIFVFSERFIVFWIGPNFIQTAHILKILGIAFVVAFAQSPQWNLMYALAKHHFMTRVTIVESAAILGLGLWLSKSHGAIGFTWATAIAILTTKLLVNPVHGAKLAGIRLVDYVRPMAMPFFSAGVLCAIATAFGVQQLLRSRGVVIFLALAISFVVAYCALTYLLTRHADYFPKEIHSFLPETLRKRLARRKSLPQAPITVGPAFGDQE